MNRAVMIMWTKNRYLAGLFLTMGGMMLLGTVSGLLLPRVPVGQLYGEAGPLALCLSADGIKNAALWLLFLFFCGFCAFCTPVTLTLCGAVFLCLGHAFVGLHRGVLSLLPVLDLALAGAATALLSYRSFLFWGILRDGHIRRAYPLEHAVLYRLCFYYFVTSGCAIAVRALAALVCRAIVSKN